MSILIPPLPESSTPAHMKAQKPAPATCCLFRLCHLSHLRKEIKDVTDCPPWDLALLPLLLEERPASLVESLALLYACEEEQYHSGETGLAVTHDFYIQITS